jgi:hypothetical protein
MYKAKTTTFSAVTLALVLGAFPVLGQSEKVDNQAMSTVTVSYVHTSIASGGNL